MNGDDVFGDAARAVLCAAGVGVGCVLAVALALLAIEALR